MEAYAPRRGTDFGLLSELGLPGAPGEQIAAARKGLPADTFGALANVLEISEGDLAAYTGISQTTLSRRKRNGRLSPDESEHVLRLALLLERTASVFEGAADGADWLKSPNVGLGNSTPLAFSRSELGAREVMNLLGRIEYGVYS